jgi:hypothetical protein
MDIMKIKKRIQKFNLQIKYCCQISIIHRITSESQNATRQKNTKGIKKD